MEVVLTILKIYWKQIAVIAFILLCLSYVGVLKFEVSHYKAKAVALEQEIADAKDTQARETKRLQAANDAITKQYADTLRQKGEVIMKGYNDAVKRIKANEASKRIVITPDVVELFNATKPETGGRSSETKPEDASKATAITEAVTKTLNDLLLVSAANDANHQVCIETVDEWQRFWEDYANSRRRITGAP